ncbi:MAG: peptidoglycan DD-metalloendopeptidase family protein, partial [FCB group bacterium]
TVKNLNERKRESEKLAQYINSLISRIHTIQDSISNLKSVYTRLNLKHHNIQNDYSVLSQKFYFENNFSPTEQIVLNKSFENEILYDSYFQNLSHELDILAARLSFMKDSISKKTNVLQEKSQENQYIKYQKEKENKIIKQNIASNQKLLKNIKVNQEALKKQLAEKQKSAVKLKSIIKNLIQQEIAKLKTAEKKATHTKENIATNTKTEEKITKHSSTNVEYHTSTKSSAPTGRYLWPVPGRNLLRTYGANKNPGSNTIFDNPGIDINAKAGTPVAAVASGSVSMIHWLPGYGKLIIINHGNGIRSVYANLSSVNVSKGQEIKQGHIIGRTGESVDGQFLHFELWSGSNRLNPSAYLR